MVVFLLVSKIRQADCQVLILQNLKQSYTERTVFSALFMQEHQHRTYSCTKLKILACTRYKSACSRRYNRSKNRHNYKRQSFPWIGWSKQHKWSSGKQKRRHVVFNSSLLVGVLENAVDYSTVIADFNVPSACWAYKTTKPAWNTEEDLTNTFPIDVIHCSVPTFISSKGDTFSPDLATVLVKLLANTTLKIL